MTSQALTRLDSYAILAYGDAGSKDTESRLRRFSGWLDGNGLHWYQPDLAAYRDMLLAEGKAPSSVSSILSTIRGAYRRLLLNNNVRDALYGLTPPNTSPADRKAVVDELITRIENAIEPRAAPVSVTVHQDRDDREYLRLTAFQASQLLAQPGVETLKGLRDTALIATLLCTGVREGELVSLEVPDLYASLGGESALQVREGKGNKARLVPYGELGWCLAIVERWLERAHITEGPVFRGFYKGTRHVRLTPLTTRAVGYILNEYPINVNGQMVTVKPHDCRRTYARRLHDAGMDLVAIQQNLGHADVKTTLRYIGTLGADKRRAAALYEFDLGALGL